jgi:hypothetical protein
MNANEFCRNFYLEKKYQLENAFDGSKKTAISYKIEALGLDEEQREKLKDVVSTLLTDVFYTILTGLDGSTSIGDSKQEAFKIYDESNNLISNCGELEAEAYSYFHDNEYEKSSNY